MSDGAGNKIGGITATIQPPYQEIWFRDLRGACRVIQSSPDVLALLHRPGKLQTQNGWI